MIRFWITEIWEQRILDNYETVMRLDSDACFTRLTWNTSINPTLPPGKVYHENNVLLNTTLQVSTLACLLHRILDIRYYYSYNMYGLLVGLKRLRILAPNFVTQLCIVARVSVFAWNGIPINIALMRCIHSVEAFFSIKTTANFRGSNATAGIRCPRSS